MKIKTVKHLSVAAIVGFATIQSVSAAVPHRFNAGEAAVAAEVNENFDHLDQRLTSLESGSPSPSTAGTIAVDCSADSKALKNTTLTPNTTYVLTGMCEGQIVAGAGLGKITIKGDSTGTKDDGIILPPGETDGDSVFSAIYALTGVHLVLENLTISAEAYNGENDLWIETVGSYRASFVVLKDVDVRGGDAGISAFNNGSILVREGVTVTNFRAYGLYTGRASLIRVFDPITVTGGSNQEGPFGGAIGAWDGGVVRTNEGNNVFTPPNGPNMEAAAIDISRNAVVSIRGGTLNGTVWVGESASADLRNVTQSGGNIDVFRLGSLHIRNSNITGASGDGILVGAFSMLRMNNTIVNNVSGANSIDTYRYGGIDIRGNSDLNGRNINCAEPRELRLDPTVVNVGTTC